MCASRKKAYPIENASFKRCGFNVGWRISRSLLNHGSIQRPRIFRRVVAEIRGKKIIYASVQRAVGRGFSGARTRVKKAGIKKRAVRRFSFPLLRFFFPFFFFFFRHCREECHVREGHWESTARMINPLKRKFFFGLGRDSYAIDIAPLPFLWYMHTFFFPLFIPICYFSLSLDVYLTSKCLRIQVCTSYLRNPYVEIVIVV